MIALIKDDYTDLVITLIPFSYINLRPWVRWH